MRQSKPFKSIKEQVQYLKENKQISFSDEESAKIYSLNHNYYNVISVAKVRFVSYFKDGKKYYLPSQFEMWQDYYEKDARMLTASKHMSDMFEKALSICNNAKAVANWLLSDVSRILNEKELHLGVKLETRPFFTQTGIILFLISLYYLVQIQKIYGFILVCL